MYLIKCDGHLLYDPRISQLKVLSAKCKSKVNSAGSASFTILDDHPHYNDLKKLKSVIEIQQDGATIFRGRMTDDSRSLRKQVVVEAEGVLACTNDTIIPPFRFPEDFPDAPLEGDEENAVEYFLNWILTKHNEHVQEWQKLKLGTVTVSDPNNVIVRSSDNYLSTWETLKSKLFDSALGGYLYVRYEDDGNYVDYVDSFRLTNTQRITLTDNVLDIVTDSDANATYTAILPLGSDDASDYDDFDENTENSTTKRDRMTIKSLPDGDLTDDLVKSGEYIYSKSGVAQYGWVCMPIADSTWDDVTLPENLQKNAITALAGGMKLARTITIKAVDLNLADKDIPTIKVFRNVILDIPTHGIDGETLPLTELETDILNPQNTVITLGDTVRTLTDINNSTEDYDDLKGYINGVKESLTHKIEGIDGTYFYIKYSQYEDGRTMTDVPDASTVYMGTCSTNQPTAPTDPNQYTWSRVRGSDGQDGQDGQDGEDAIVLQIDSTNGNIFKNSGIATTLLVTVITGGQLLDSSAKLQSVLGDTAYLQWESKRQGETVFKPISRNDSRLSDNGFIFTLNVQDVETKTVFNCNLYV